MRIEVDCERIRRNTEVVVKLCASRAIDVVGVTKACCGHPHVAQAMLDGGVAMLAEARLGNVRRLRQGGIRADTMLLRIPKPSQVAEVVALTQVSLNSELETVRALSQAAQSQGITHGIVLMVETGDRREGVLPEEALEVARAILWLPNLELIGIGTNVGCIGGVLPTLENTQLLVDLAESIERALSFRFRLISGGHTASMALIGRDEMPARVNQVRVGEGILLGVDSAGNWPLPCPYQDAFAVVAEVIEVKTKPSMPEGQITVDAFGRVPHWVDRGLRRRAILAVGEQDLRVDGLHPRRPGVTVIAGSSDHLVVDVTEASPPVRLGDELEFAPNYAAVCTAMASRDVQQIVKSANTRSANRQTTGV